MRTPIEKYLEQFKGEEIYYKPNPGNGGDALIAFSALQLFKKLKIDYKIISAPVDLTDKIVFYAGGGNLVDYYSHCANFVESNHSKVRKLIILPHTIKGHNELLSSLGTNVEIFCRELTSYNYMQQYKNIGGLYLDDDLVLDMEITPYLLAYKKTKRLITLAKVRFMAASIYKGRKPISTFFRQIGKEKTLYAFRQDVESTNQDLPKGNVDLTGLINLSPEMTDEKKIERTCQRILSTMNRFDVIYTNRLHVCIPAAMLGKTVNFYDNAYHKNKSIYEFSLKEKFPNVNWKTQ